MEKLICIIKKYTFDDDGYTVTLADPRYGDGSYDDEDECSGDLADFDTQED